jgi:hypothetical protein
MSACAYPACDQPALSRSRYCAAHQLDAPYDRGWLPAERDTIDWLSDRVQRDADGPLGPERLAGRLVLVRLLREEPDLARLAAGVAPLLAALTRLADHEPPPGDLSTLSERILREWDAQRAAAAEGEPQI